MGLRSTPSRAVLGLTAMLFAGLLVQGCGNGSGDSGGTTSGTPAGATAAMPAVSPYDAGPRAGEQPIDESLVKKGEALFSSKGCTACHGFGRRISCPDLDGVTMRRTTLWMEHQILHPEVMTKQDPIAHQLFAQYSLQMPNQGLKPDEAQAVIEFLKHKNHESAGSK
jgi:mono/diheme cytochrome c family protein